MEEIGNWSKKALANAAPSFKDETKETLLRKQEEEQRSADVREGQKNGLQIGSPELDYFVKQKSLERLAKERVDDWSNKINDENKRKNIAPRKKSI